MSYQEKKISPDVFRAYDIRGVVDEQFNEDSFYTLGKAIAVRLNELGRADIILGRDGRLTSQALAQALLEGLISSGINIVDLGEVPTPVLYFATHTRKIDSGLMVTGSHNPAAYNGLKIVLTGKTLLSSDIQNLYKIVQKGQYLRGKGHYLQAEILSQYRQRIVQDIHLLRPFKVVVDCGNGIAGPVVPPVLKQLGCEVIPLYCEVDGHFPNHHPDPTIEANLVDLKAKVIAEKADIGFAFDGDSDRLGVITNTGELIWPDRLMMFYAQEILRDKPGATIVYDVKCSSHLAKIINNAGGVAKMCPTGHSIVKSIMKEEKAILAGEMSGHLFFQDRWYGFDDALYSACRLLEMLSLYPVTVAEQFAKIPNSINTPEIKIAIPEETKFSLMDKFCQVARFPGANIIAIDGLRVEFPHGWGLLRASNTTPCLIARFEAQDEQSLVAIKTLFKQQLQTLEGNLELSAF